MSEACVIFRKARFPYNPITFIMMHTVLWLTKQTMELLWNVITLNNLEFYQFFGNAIGRIMADSFNYAFENGGMSISEKRGISSLIPKKDRQKISQKLETNLPLNSNYKISKPSASHLEKVLPTIISPNQTGYVKGRYIGESTRIITAIWCPLLKRKTFQAYSGLSWFWKSFGFWTWNMALPPNILI